MLNDQLIRQLLDKNINKNVFLGNFGIEKENIRVDAQGKLALTPHPKGFGSKLENPFIKTDFSESQIEMVTPVLDSIDQSYDFLNTLHDIVTLELRDEYLWPSSNPPELPDEENIPIADMNDSMANEYRIKLASKYGRKKQLFSGIHFNFSFQNSYLKEWYEGFYSHLSFKEFKDTIYLKVVRNTLRYRWLLIYLTGASPVFHSSFNHESIKESEELVKDSYTFEGLNSLRNSQYGYRNHKPFYISFDTIEDYVNDLRSLIQNGQLINEKEFYSQVRLKTRSRGEYLQQLMDHGVDYIELRMLDLNPLEKIGISKKVTYFVHIFLVYMLMINDEPLDMEEQKIASLNEDTLIKKGITGKIQEKNTSYLTFRDKALEIISDMEEMLKRLNSSDIQYRTVLDGMKKKILEPNLTYGNQVKLGIKESAFITYHLKKAKEYYVESLNHGYQFKGYDDLELSTQLLLKAAIKRGIEFEIIDRSENFIALKKGSHLQYVKQATKTALDSYITALIMENKLVTKHILNQQGIRIPNGHSYSNMHEALSKYEVYKNKPIVIKPKSTNFGIGITIFKDPFTKEDYYKAIEMAFLYDETILLEELIKGKEYRFLVMGDEVVGILHRVPANVVGDGIHTIEQLVAEKNKNPLRGKGYKTPLEKIALGEVERMFLKNQGKCISDIPQKDEWIYLRENSNISTGGDSIDYTDEIPGSYKEIAIKAAKAAGAVFCGVDMMIEDIHAEASDINYGIIEINFNPAIHIHCYPYKGKNRKADEKILDLLFGK